MNATRDGASDAGVAPDDRPELEGSERPDGRVGFRNRVLVLPSVICSHVVADRIAARVPGAESAPHDHGCAQIGADNEQTERTFLGAATNPNVAGTLVVGLGCEHVQSDDVAEQLAAMDAPVRETSIQDEGGTDATIERGVELAGELVESARADTVAADPSDVTVGVVSGDLHDATVAEADPLVGAFVDDLVAAGGRVVAAGAERLTAHPDAARAAAASDEAEGKVEELLARHGDVPAKETSVRRMAGERAFADGTRAWGDQPIRDVLAYGETATHDEGLAVVDAPSQFAGAATALAAAGAQVVVHVTDEGVPTGHPIAPVVKVTGNGATYEALETDMDVDATATSPAELFEYVVRVLNGERSCAERHGLNDFAITRVGPSM